MIFTVGNKKKQSNESGASEIHSVCGVITDQFKFTMNCWTTATLTIPCTLQLSRDVFVTILVFLSIWLHTNPGQRILA